MILDRVALAAAERVYASAGARAGLYAFDALAAKAPSPRVRGEAILRAIECAVEAGARDDAARLAASWTGAPGADWDARVVAVSLALAGAGLVPAALDLARAESRARPQARLAYLVGRLCAELGDAGRADAIAAFAEAEERAEREGAGAIAAHARLRRARAVAEAEGVAAAAEIAKGVAAADVGPNESMQLARILLGARSRFARATGLGHLEALAAGGDRATRARCAAIAIAHGERAGDALSALEADRIAAVLKHGADAPERRAAAARLPQLGGRAPAVDVADVAARTAEGRALVQRARALLGGAGRNMRAPAGSMDLELTWLAHDVCAAVADGDRPAAARALLALTARCRDATRVPRPVWTAIALATAVPGMVRADALALAARALELRAEAPARGWASVGAALLRAGREDLAEAALRRGLAAGEPAAERALFEIARSRGWRAARRGERDLALAALREAKRIAAGVAK